LVKYTIVSKLELNAKADSVNLLYVTVSLGINMGTLTPYTLG